MSGECEDCGADGVTLHCICEPKRAIEKAQAEVAKPRVMIKAPLKPAPREGTVIPIAVGGPSVKCCECGDTHLLYRRHDERGNVLGKHMSGRSSWCPKCRYGVFVQVD